MSRPHLTRRSIFAVLFGALAAKFVRKPKEATELAYRQGGHTFYSLRFDRNAFVMIFPPQTDLVAPDGKIVDRA